MKFIIVLLLPHEGLGFVGQTGLSYLSLQDTKAVTLYYSNLYLFFCCYSERRVSDAVELMLSQNMCVLLVFALLLLVANIIFGSSLTNVYDFVLRYVYDR